MIDGTYELFRHYYALPSAWDRDGRQVAAVRGVLGSVLGMIRGGATHVAVATDICPLRLDMAADRTMVARRIGPCTGAGRYAG